MAIAPSATEKIIGAALTGAEAIFSEVRSEIVQTVSKRFRVDPTIALMSYVRRVFDKMNPLMVDHLLDTDLAGWVAGMDTLSKQFPAWVWDEFKTGVRSMAPRPPQPPTLFRLLGMFDDEPRLRFPLIEEAAARLSERNVMTREQWDNTTEAARQRAFMITGDVTEDTLADVRNLLSRNIDEGTSLKGFKEQLGDVLESSGIGPARIENIYRTNVQAAFRDGRETLASDPIVSELFPYQQYIPIHDGRTRSTHLELGRLGLNGTGVYRRDDPFWDFWTPPNGFQCLLPDSVVEGRFELASRSLYSGEAIEIVTRSGKRLSVTVNHPVLTQKGFVAAGMIQEGDNVVSYESDIDAIRNSNHSVSSSAISHASYDPRGFSPNVDKQYAPTCAAEVFASLALYRQQVRIPTSPNDLHGEAASCDGYVDVVGSDWPLRNGLHTPGRKGVNDFKLTLSDPLSSPTITSNRDSLASPLALGFVSASIPGSRALGNDFSPVGLNTPPFRELCIGPAAYLNASRYELPSHGGSVASSFEGNLLERFPGVVKLDEVVKVRRYGFSGHVYDFQSNGGWMVANNIIVSNCRCGVRMMTIEAAARAGVTEAAQWLKNGRPPERPEWRLDAIPFAPTPGFGSRGRVAA